MIPELPPRLGPGRKVVIGLGDHTITFTLAALALLYVFFLIEEVGLRPGLAGLVPLVGRFVDAFTDPLMGRISDLTRSRFGRRRPYLLLGAVPFGVTFAALWIPVPLESQGALFAYYAASYVLFSVASTVVSVPYTALLPELVEDYQERNSLHTYRQVLAVLGTLLAAIGVTTLVDAFGGGASGHFQAASLIAVWLIAPWFAIYATSVERPDFRSRPSVIGWRASLGQLARQRSFRQLSGLYICGRIALDVGAMMFRFWVVLLLLREGDFEWVMGILLLTAILSLPGWLWISARTDKRSVFVAGCSIWLAVQPLVWLAGPDWPRSWVLAVAALVGLGFAVVDLMPWSMIGEVIDEDELVSGERREGLYAGAFTFLRKLGGAVGVALAGGLLDWAGVQQGGGPQPPTALIAIRAVMALGPAVFLALAIAFALPYALSRTRHREILRELEQRRAG